MVAFGIDLEILCEEDAGHFDFGPKTIDLIAGDVSSNIQYCLKDFKAWVLVIDYNGCDGWARHV